MRDEGERAAAVTSSRRGARSAALVPEEVRQALAAGAPSVNHVEQMVLDMGDLLAHEFPELAHRAEMLRIAGFLDRLRAGTRVLVDAYGDQAPLAAAGSRSDTVRGWGAFATVLLTEDPAARVVALTPFAQDPHFAVREWAWLAMRDLVVRLPEACLVSLERFARSARSVDELGRRFAVEATRPRGVWSAHVPLLKAQPELAEPLLESVLPAQSRYLQDSLSNWINDATRTRPDWAERLAEQWAETHGLAGSRLLRRARRSLPAAAR